jgi:hypothetical protein
MIANSNEIYHICVEMGQQTLKTAKQYAMGEKGNGE